MCRGFLGCVLVSINLLVLIVGVALATVGGLLKWNKDFFRNIIDQLLQQIEGIVVENEQMDEIILQIETILSSMALGLFIGGLIMVIISLICFIGVCCHATFILIVYTILIGILIVVHVTIFIAYFSNKSLFLHIFDGFLKKSMDNYVSLENKDGNSVLMGGIMQQFQCCGHHNGTDFLSHGSKFSGKDAYGEQVFPKITYPLPCCDTMKMEGSAPSPGSCPNTFTYQNSNIYFGCAAKTMPLMEKYITTLMLMTLIALVLNIMVFSLAVIIIVIRKKE